MREDTDALGLTAEDLRVTIGGTVYDVLLYQTECVSATGRPSQLHEHDDPHLDGTPGQPGHHHHIASCDRRQAILVPADPKPYPSWWSLHQPSGEVRTLSVKSTAEQVEKRLDNMANPAASTWIAVEVYDAPESHWSDEHDGDIGPWVLGPDDVVRAYLAEQGWTDFEVQYTVEVVAPPVANEVKP